MDVAAAETAFDLSRTLGRAGLILTIMLTPLVFDGRAAEGTEFPKLALLVTAVLGGLCLVLWRVMTNGTGPVLGVPRDWLAWGGLALVASGAVSTVLAIHPRSAFFGAHGSSAGFLTLASYATLFFLVRLLRPSAPQIRTLLVACMLSAQVAAAYALLQTAGLDPLNWEADDVGRAYSTLGHVNHLGAYLAIVLPLALVAACDAWKRRKHLMLAWMLVLVPCLVASLALTFCRAAWLGAGVGLMLLVVLQNSPQFSWRGVALAGVAVLGCGIGVSVWLLTRPEDPAMPPRTGVISSPGDFALRTASIGSRLEIWKVCGAILKAYPFAGCGPDNLQLAFGPARSVEYARLEWGVTPDRAHHELIHLAATQGLPGFLAAIAVVGGLMQAGVVAWNRTGNEDRAWLAAMLAGLAAFAVNSQLSYTSIGFGTTAVVFAGIVSVCGTQAMGHARTRGRGLEVVRPIAGMAAVVGSVLLATVWVKLVYRPYFAQIRWREAERLAPSRPDLAVHCMEAALAENVNDDALWRVRGGLEMEAARQVGARAARDSWLRRAQASLAEAIRLSPRNSMHHWLQALIHQRHAETSPEFVERGFTSMDEALALDPHHGFLWSEAVRLAASVNHADRLERWARRGRELFPGHGTFPGALGFLELSRGKASAAVPLLEEAWAGTWQNGHDARISAGANLVAAYRQTREFDRLAKFGEVFLRDMPPSPQLLPVRRVLERSRRETADE